MGITTHVLDTSLGRPAAGMAVTLEASGPGATWRQIGAGTTDADGDQRSLVPDGTVIEAGSYRLTFDTGPYYAATGRSCFYPAVQITFQIAAPEEHHHLPLLISPYAYWTYRGT